MNKKKSSGVWWKQFADADNAYRNLLFEESCKDDKERARAWRHNRKKFPASGNDFLYYQREFEFKAAGFYRPPFLKNHLEIYRAIENDKKAVEYLDKLKREGHI